MVHIKEIERKDKKGKILLILPKVRIGDMEYDVDENMNIKKRKIR